MAEPKKPAPSLNLPFVAGQIKVIVTGRINYDFKDPRVVVERKD